MNKEEFKCKECGNNSFNWVDFTAKSVKECEQCKTRFYDDEEELNKSEGER